MTVRMLKKSGALIVCAGLSLSLVTGCARGPSQKELGVLEETGIAAKAAEQDVAGMKAKKAKLERKVAEKRAEKKALQKKKKLTAKALTEMATE